MALLLELKQEKTFISTAIVTPPYEKELSLEPGLYLLNVFVQWQEFGDASYGFLVEVPPAQGAEPPGEESEVSVVVILAEAGLNLRSEPDLSSEVIGYLPRNDLVDVIGQSPDGDWWQVAGVPDLGVYTRPEQQPVDFGIWQAKDGTPTSGCPSFFDGSVRLEGCREGAECTLEDPQGIGDSDSVVGDRHPGFLALHDP